MSQRPDGWNVDLEDPRAPPQDLWDRMSEGQRQQVVDSLPSEFPPSEARPPEGDEHTEQVYGARTALRRFFGRTGRHIYVGTNLPVYYPGQSMFSPDVIAVLDVDTHPRPSWIVSKEGKGLDFAMEVLVLGNRRKDLDRNVRRYAHLGIYEYFVFDRPRLTLQGFRLQPREKDVSGYEPIVPQHGSLVSKVLGLELRVKGERLRFHAGDAPLPAAHDLIEQLEGSMDDLEARLAHAESRAEAAARRAEDEARRAQDEARRAEGEARRAQEAERRAQDEARRAETAEHRLREALAELERLRHDK